MGKALPVLGIVGASFAALVAAVFVDNALFVPLLVVLAGSIVLVGQRSIPGAIAGLLVLALGVVALLGLLESVGTKAGDTDFGITREAGTLFALLACIAIPVGAIALRWDQGPRWLAIAGLALAVAAAIAAATDPSGLSDHGQVRTVVNAVLCLALIAPMIPLLQGDDGPAAAPAARPPGRRP